MQCKICFEKYNNTVVKPYSLYPCSHSFCIRCLEALPQKECPKCKREIRDKQPNYDLLEALEELHPVDSHLKKEIQSLLDELLNFKSTYELKLIESYKFKEAKIDTMRSRVEERTNQLIQKLIDQQDFLFHEMALIESEYNFKLDECKSSFLKLESKLNGIKDSFNNINDVDVLASLLNEIKSIDYKSKINELDSLDFEDYEYSENEKFEIEIKKKEPIDIQLLNNLSMIDLNEQVPNTNPLIRSFKAHTDIIKSLAVISSSKKLITGSKDKLIKIWNLQNGRLIRTIRGVNSCVRALAVLDNKNIVSGSCANKIQIWNSSNGALVRTLNGHSSKVNALVVLANNLIASGSKDKTIRIWDSTNGEIIRMLTGHSGAVWVLNVLNDNNYIVSGSDDKTVKIWNWQTGELIRIINGHTNWINSLTVLSNNDIVSASDDSILRVWNSDTGELIRSLEGHSDSIKSITVLRDNLIASGSSDRTIKIWNSTSGELITSVENHSSEINLLAILNSDFIVSASHDLNIKIWCQNLLS